MTGEVRGGRGEAEREAEERGRWRERQRRGGGEERQRRGRRWRERGRREAEVEREAEERGRWRERQRGGKNLEQKQQDPGTAVVKVLDSSSTGLQEGGGRRSSNHLQTALNRLEVEV